ncbi:HpcH/HpaI aldolase/citrate lyase family protein [Ottowia sp.]|jgi:4-hydroxy-2-oxoheptanedioate aldolase|uniref:HpcH/HpaI aldolase/citrate lyase family protein n=1 Tax=Ottowia sp. TaxID=1898956 RepID=UPI0025F2ABF3|nr:HpcH/HpaI aldolase/citrate lyase family protein [Ottowia sp.]MBK6615278.1 HpcH/HpaI aldolase/citrate lyase family protein [Ottowia sp.]MBK6746351.1 HpcH/HpaI aldolase/citrate lyase family protein [Ottowia sp.]
MKTPHNPFKQALAEGRTQIGLWAALASPYSTELLAGIGYDWLLLDGEHAPNDLRSTLGQLQGVASAQHAFGDARSHPVVRVPLGTGEAGTALIKQYLDIGAQTLLVPMVDTPEQAAQVAAACRYPPAGVRGMGSSLARSARWNAHPRYVHEANGQVCVLVQAETALAMRHLDAIAATPGVDGVFIGPADLSASMGHPGNAAHPDVQAAIEQGIARILKAGKAPGILATSEPRARKWLAAGALFVAVGIDTALLASGAQALLGQFKEGTAAASGAGY